jgi:hypothetical protein
VRRRHELLLYDRVALVRPELLEIADQVDDDVWLDPDGTAELLRLLRDGCASPLYNREVHPSELLAAVYYMHRRLCRRSAGDS